MQTSDFETLSCQEFHMWINCLFPQRLNTERNSRIPSSALHQGFLELQTHAIAINSRKAKVLAAEYGKEADMQISANYLHHHRLVHCLDLPGWQGSCIASKDPSSKGPVLPHE